MSEKYYAKSDASSAGAVLAAAREELNLSIGEVARHLKLSPAQVEALEEGAYDRLPGRVFVRGFLRNYAKLLGLDPQPLLQRIDTEMPPPAVVEERPPPPHEVMPTGDSSRWTVYGGIAGVIIVALAAYEFGFNAPPSQSANEETSAGKTGGAPADTAATQSSPATASAPETASSAAEPGASAQGAASSPLDAVAGASASAPPDAAAAAAAKASDAHELHFSFDQDSWVEVRDANDKVVLRKLNRAGSEERVSGTPPFRLVVGNARTVHLTYDGEAVDLGPHIGQTVARLTLK
jgi:cytoskeleton protein RodZ